MCSASVLRALAPTFCQMLLTYLYIIFFPCQSSRLISVELWPSLCEVVAETWFCSFRLAPLGEHFRRDSLQDLLIRPHSGTIDGRKHSAIWFSSLPFSSRLWLVYCSAVFWVKGLGQRKSRENSISKSCGDNLASGLEDVGVFDS